VEITNEVDVFSGSKREADAKEFETRGITVFARCPCAATPGLADPEVAVEHPLSRIFPRTT
jgi:hypothetical protein